MNSKIIDPVLLSKAETDWLLGKLQVSKSYEWKLKSTIRRKVRAFTELELPLLEQKGFLENCGLERAKCLTGLHHRSPQTLNNLPNLNATIGQTTVTLPLAVRSLPQTVRIGQRSFDDGFWVKFEQYRRNNQSSKTVEDRLGYARKYLHVLVENDAQDLNAVQ